VPCKTKRRHNRKSEKSLPWRDPKRRKAFKMPADNKYSSPGQIGNVLLINKYV